MIFGNLLKKKEENIKEDKSNSFYVILSEDKLDTYELWEYKGYNLHADSYVCTITPNDKEHNTFLESYTLCDILNGYVNDPYESLFQYSDDVELWDMICGLINSSRDVVDKNELLSIVKEYLQANTKYSCDLGEALVNYMHRKNIIWRKVDFICEDIAQQVINSNILEDLDENTDYDVIYEYVLSLLNEKLNNPENKDIIVLDNFDWFTGFHEDYYTEINLIHRIYAYIGLNIAKIFNIEHLFAEANDYAQWILDESLGNYEEIPTWDDYYVEVQDYLHIINTKKYGFQQSQIDNNLDDLNNMLKKTYNNMEKEL